MDWVSRPAQKLFCNHGGHTIFLVVRITDSPVNRTDDLGSSERDPFDWSKSSVHLLARSVRDFASAYRSGNTHRHVDCLPIRDKSTWLSYTYDWWHLYSRNVSTSETSVGNSSVGHCSGELVSFPKLSATRCPHFDDFGTDENRNGRFAVQYWASYWRLRSSSRRLEMDDLGADVAFRFHPCGPDLLPETSSKNVLYRRVQRLRKITGNDKFMSQAEIAFQHVTAGKIAKMTMIQP
jgi:hypothetical protein